MDFGVLFDGIRLTSDYIPESSKGPSCLFYSQQFMGRHSPQIGWAADGDLV
jgi:hypothetical protein